VTFVPHIRLTMSGLLGDGTDMFSMSLSLRRQAPSTWVQWLEAGGADDDTMEAWRDACVAWFGSLDAHISNRAALKRIKIAYISADGTYGAAPTEYAVNQVGIYGPVAQPHPWNVALAVTLGTDADLERVKGRIFLPLPAVTLDDVTDMILASEANEIRDGVVSLINDIADAPGPDLEDFRVVVASQGRHNANGSVRVPPGNHDVQRVQVGRRLDTQRRRQNKVPEAYSSWAAVDQV
jgi:hypothetical protein